jgi:4-hydroxybenzoate polyprenyltransferase
MALVAGAAAPNAIPLGVAMAAMQAAIGVVNDLADAPADAVAKPAKPIPSGLVSVPAAWLVAGLGIVLGILLSAIASWGTAAIAILGLAVGFAYDLRLKGTVWSWLPFALGLPLLPVYAWFGAAGSLPGEFVVLVPTAIAAGAALAIGNAFADLERDEASGVESIATRLGAERAWVVVVAVLAGAGVAALVSAAAWGATAAQLTIVGLAALLPVAAALASRGLTPAGRERAWEAEAVGVALVGVAWMWVALA